MSRLRIFDPNFSDPFEPLLRRWLTPMPFETDVDALQIRVDVAESEKAYSIKADLPGVKKDDIHVRIDGNTVQIDASTHAEKESKDNGGRVLRSERYSGAVSRSMTLGHDIDESKAAAKFENGVLTLELPKRAAAASKQITIQ
jgi:HSP20 family protein